MNDDEQKKARKVARKLREAKVAAVKQRMEIVRTASSVAALVVNLIVVGHIYLAN